MQKAHVIGLDRTCGQWREPATNGIGQCSVQALAFDQLATWRVDPDQTAVASVVAVLDDEDTTVELIAEVTRLTPEYVNGTLTWLVGEGLLMRGRFADPAVRSAVLASLSYDRYRVLRLRVAEALYDRGEPDPVVATHLLRAGCGDDTDMPWAAAVMERAAEAALDDDDLELTIEYLSRAQAFHCTSGRKPLCGPNSRMPSGPGIRSARCAFCPS